MTDTLKITSERIDDVVLLLHLMKRVGLAELLNEPLPRYRDEWIVEQGFHRLKGAPLSMSPLFVQRDDQIKGLFACYLWRCAFSA